MRDLIKMPLGQYHILKSVTVGLFYMLFSVQLLEKMVSECFTITLMGIKVHYVC